MVARGGSQRLGNEVGGRKFTNRGKESSEDGRWQSLEVRVEVGLWRSPKVAAGIGRPRSLEVVAGVDR